jgi:hypothetical protein
MDRDRGSVPVRGAGIVVMITRNTEFEARVARIAANQRKGGSMVYAGVDEAYLVQYGNRRRSKQAASGGTLSTLALVLALALGLTSHGVAQYLQLRLLGLPPVGADPTVTMGIQVVFAMAVAALVSAFLKIRARGPMLMLMIGATIGVLMGHNIVHMYPAEAAQAFSAAWADRVLATTEPMSIYWRGTSFTF